MSSRIEWATVDAATFYGRPGQFMDQYGTQNDGPAVGVFTGSDGWVIEAQTPQDLVAWLDEVSGRVRAAHPEVWPNSE